MAEGIYSVTVSEWKLVQRRLDGLENIVSGLKLKLENCQCNVRTDLETGHSVASGIIDIFHQSTTQSEEALTLAVTATARDKSSVVDSTLTVSTSSGLNDGSSTGIPVSTNSTLRLSNGMGMEILEIEKYRRAQVKLTRCDDVEVKRTLLISRNASNNSTSTFTNNGSQSLSKKRSVHRRKGNGARIEHVSALPSSHLKRFVCHFCSKRFDHNSHLTQHIRVHTGEKPFHCNICPMKFNRRSTLKAHIRIHTGDKPFQCNICLKKFNRRSTLRKHSRVCTGDMPFDCSFCSQKFGNRSSLLIHTRHHKGLKSLECGFCSKKFYDRSQLMKHFKVHTKEKPYSCPVCPKVFGYSTSLKLHLKRHPRETPQSQSEIQHKDVPGSEPS